MMLKVSSQPKGTIRRIHKWKPKPNNQKKKEKKGKPYL